jgi:hypothetical protein
MEEKKEKMKNLQNKLAGKTRCLANHGSTFSTSEDLENQTEQNLQQRAQGTVAVLTREIAHATPFSSVSLHRQHRIRPPLPSPQEPSTEDG